MGARKYPQTWKNLPGVIHFETKKILLGKVALLFFCQLLTPEIIKVKARNTPGLTKCAHPELHSVLGIMLDLVSGSLSLNCFCFAAVRTLKQYEDSDTNSLTTFVSTFFLLLDFKSSFKNRAWSKSEVCKLWPMSKIWPTTFFV